MENNWIAGWTVGIAAFLILLGFAPAVTCGDGWASPSIGIQGACSHHGGVGGTGVYGLFAFWSSVGLGVFVAKRVETRQRIRASHQLAQVESSKIELIGSAIKAKRLVEFMYRKAGHSSQTCRTVLPRNFANVLQRNGVSVPCFVGFCTMLQSNRAFSLDRMSAVRIVDGLTPTVFDGEDVPVAVEM